MAKKQNDTFLLPDELIDIKPKKAKASLYKRTGDIVDIFDLPILPRNRGVNKHGRRYIYEELSELSEKILGLRKKAIDTSPIKRKLNKDDLINAESKVGRDVFDNDAPNCEFFMFKKNVWLYYTNGLIVRYEVREDGVFKKIGDSGYNRIRAAELDNFRLACKKYFRLVKAQLYS